MNDRYVPLYTLTERQASQYSKRKKHFADYVVYVSLAAVAIYTTTAFILQFTIGVEISPTLTTCFFSFFGVELASLAVIKHGKEKYKPENKQNEEVNYRGT